MTNRTVPGAPGRGRGWAYGVLVLVTALVAALVIWRTVDPPSTGGSAVAGSTLQDTPTPPTGTSTDDTGSSQSTDDTGDETSSDETSTDETSTDETSSDETTTSEGPPSTDSDPLTVGVPTLPTEPDPAQATSSSDFVLWRQVVDTLTTYDGTGTDPQPQLAADWTPDAKAMNWTFALASGRQFHDGKPVTAEAVCQNFDHWSKAKGKVRDAMFEWNYYFGFPDRSDPAYRSCRANGAEELTLTFTRPMPSLPDILTDAAFGILAPSSMGTEHPVGSGPYQWESADPSTVELTAVDPSSSPPEITFRAIGDPAAGRQAVEAGEVDLFYSGSSSPASTEQSGGDLTLSPAPAASMLSLYLTARKGPLADGKVRRGLLSLIDRDAVSRVAGVEKATSLLPGVFGAPPQDLPITDPAAGKKLLQGKNLSLTLLVRGYSPTDRSVGEVLAENLRSAGVKVKLNPIDSPGEFFQAVSDGSADMWVGSFQTFNADLADYVRVFGPNSTYGAAVPAASRKTFDAALQTVNSTGDNAIRQQTSRAMLDDLVAGNSVLPLYTSGSVWMVGTEVSGFEPAPFRQTRLDGVRTS